MDRESFTDFSIGGGDGDDDWGGNKEQSPHADRQSVSQSLRGASRRSKQSQEGRKREREREGGREGGKGGEGGREKSV